MGAELLPAEAEQVSHKILAIIDKADCYDDPLVSFSLFFQSHGPLNLNDGLWQ
jgi:hypothetical protein